MGIVGPSWNTVRTHRQNRNEVFVIPNLNPLLLLFLIGVTTLLFPLNTQGVLPPVSFTSYDLVSTTTTVYIPVTSTTFGRRLVDYFSPTSDGTPSFTFCFYMLFTVCEVSPLVGNLVSNVTGTTTVFYRNDVCTPASCIPSIITKPSFRLRIGSYPFLSSRYVGSPSTVRVGTVTIPTTHTIVLRFPSFTDVSPDLGTRTRGVWGVDTWVLVSCRPGSFVTSIKETLTWSSTSHVTHLTTTSIPPVTPSLVPVFFLCSLLHSWGVLFTPCVLVLRGVPSTTCNTSHPPSRYVHEKGLVHKVILIFYLLSVLNNLWSYYLIYLRKIKRSSK